MTLLREMEEEDTNDLLAELEKVGSSVQGEGGGGTYASICTCVHVWDVYGCICVNSICINIIYIYIYIYR
jgi:hypothetical protein